MMKRICAALLVGAQLMLAACTTPGLGDIEEAAQQESGLAKRLADRLLGEVAGMDHRAVRMCMIAAVASELVAYRVAKEPEDAMMGLGQISALESAVVTFQRADAMWLNTEIAHITLMMTGIMVDSAQARIPRLLGAFAGGINIPGLLDRAAIAAGQGSLLSAGIQDIKERMLALNDGSASAEESMAACTARMTMNRDKVGAMVGVPPVVPE